MPTFLNDATELVAYTRDLVPNSEFVSDGSNPNQFRLAMGNSLYIIITATHTGTRIHAYSTIQHLQLCDLMLCKSGGHKYRYHQRLAVNGKMYFGLMWNMQKAEAIKKGTRIIAAVVYRYGPYAATSSRVSIANLID
jgi:hypothetical protein